MGVRFPLQSMNEKDEEEWYSRHAHDIQKRQTKYVFLSVKAVDHLPTITCLLLMIPVPTMG